MWQPGPTPAPSSLTYSPAHPGWAAPTGPPARPPRHTGAKVFGATLIGYVIVALVMGLLVYLPPSAGTTSPYGYLIVDELTVPPDQPWTFTLPLPTGFTSTATRSGWPGIIDIYSDPGLTIPFDLFSTTMGRTITGWAATFTPARVTLPGTPDWPGAPAVTYLGNPDAWPPGTYYIAERQDRLGRTLGQPRVHVYTVGATGPGLPAPDATMDVTEQGIPRFTWSAVDGASSYHILRTATADGKKTTLIGTAPAGATTWLSSGQDMTYQNARQNAQDVLSYNASFEAAASDGSPCKAQDQDYNGTDPPPWDDSQLAYPTYSVVAVDDQGNTSLPMPIDSRDVLAKVPVAAAGNTISAMAENAGASRQTYLPDPYPVTMGDCHTAFFPVQPQSLVWSQVSDKVGLAYAVTGTLLTQTLTAVTGQPGYDEVVGLGQAAGVPQWHQFGTMQDLSYMTPSQAVQYGDGMTPSTTAPESGFTWNGTSDMVKYIAANMFAGQTAIDMSRFLADPAAPTVYDAANEAVLQNPYITDVFPVIGFNNNVLYVDYEITTEQRVAAAARIKDKVDSVTAAIITPDMGDREKALAINKYLATNAVYDYAGADFANKGHTRDEYLEKFPTSWTAEGVLIQGTGVCVSYAAAYKALADAAGLNTVTVVGTADNSDTDNAHEWIKAQINGTWRVIDPTWNSNLYEQIRGNVQTYFGLTDAEAKRTQYNSFVVDAFISQYDAV